MARPRTGGIGPGLPAPPVLPAASVWADGALSVGQACEFLGVSTTTLTELRMQGRVVWGRVGGKVVLAKRSLVAFLETCRA